MPDWLSTWFGKRRPASPLARRLGTYPAYDAPFVGRGRALTVDQARANLAYFEQALTGRLRVLATLLREDAGIEVDAALAAPLQQAGALADALHRWAADHWPALPGCRPATRADWWHSRRAGNDIALSLALDVAILLGELVRRGNPTWRWAIDLAPQHLADDLPSARRVVLQASPVGATPHPGVLDVEDAVVQRFLHPDDPAAGWANPFRRLIETGLRGEVPACGQPDTGTAVRPSR